MNMLNILKVLVAVLLGIASICSAVEGTWTSKTDMPTARSGLSSSVADGKIYAIGGGPSTGVVTLTVEQYDPVSDTWTKKANMRNPRGFFGASTINGKVYAIGGYGSGGAHLSSVEEYDPVADTWTTRASMPTARDHLATAAVEGKIYAIGGFSSNNSVSAVEEYDPATDTWTRKANMPTRRLQVSCSTVDGIIYAIGGFPSIGGSPMSVVEAYDPATDTWATKAPMPTARGFFSTCVVNGKIYAIGGCSNPYNSSELSSVEAYDPTMDTWRKMADMQVRRKALASAAVNGKIYAIGGQPVAGWDAPLSTMEEYDIGLSSPQPDLTGDGAVDIKDLLKLIESWGQDEPTVDIAPSSGDGVVDVLDLELLMSYWGQPVDDPTLIAHWALDEAEGDIAFDSAGYNDAVTFGAPLWQPSVGIVDGAIELDGVDDCVIIGSIPNPTERSFSVLAWIKGGAPGQVVLSQISGVNWLCTDSLEGNLMTELKGTGRDAAELLSQTIITDGNWHRIGLVWDGAYRTLYVDDIAVAEDAQANLLGSENGLYIGTGKAMEAGTYWSGLIDDVRIYNRVVVP